MILNCKNEFITDALYANYTGVNYTTLMDYVDIN
ncbi:hypothetical protein NIES22_33790 [Calothrix brevissima NIES-22]|nr:hypothetical protein NIES22_33790 [Calothrix brevissima NIES-22]